VHIVYVRCCWLSNWQAGDANKRDIIYTSMTCIGKWTQKDTSGHRFRARSCSMVILKGFRSAEGLAQWLPEAMRLANQVKTTEIWPEAVLWFSLDVV
jgi:hypothetical protein